MFSNIGFQTLGSRSSLSRFMGSWLFLIRMASVVLLSQYPGTVFTTRAFCQSILWLVLATCITIPLFTSLFLYCSSVFGQSDLKRPLGFTRVELVAVLTWHLINHSLLLLLRYPVLHFHQCPLQCVCGCEDCTNVQSCADSLQLLAHSANIWGT